MEGEVIGGRYRLDARLGSGAMSEVWGAYDLELERTVAVKLLGPGTDAIRFAREAQTAAALSHPNICRVYDFGETDGSPYIVFEHLAGGTLEARLRPGEPLADADTARVADDLAAGLAHAHAHGVLHRDVKPSNVLFDDEGNAKLADFGIARLGDASTLTEAGTMLGTAAYISPEQARAEPVTPASDVYSFGVVLYRLLTGDLPFYGEAPLDLALKHVHEEPTPIAELRPDAPPALERVATWSLAKRPEDRPPNGAALAAALAQGAHVPAAADDETVVVRSQRRRRRTPQYVAIGAGLALLAVTGAALAILANPEPSRAPITPTKRQTTKRVSTATSPAPPPPPVSRPTTSERTTTAERPTTAKRPTTTAPPPPAEPPPSPPPPPPPPTAPPPPTTPPPPPPPPPTEPPPTPPPPPPPTTATTTTTPVATTTTSTPTVP